MGKHGSYCIMFPLCVLFPKFKGMGSLVQVVEIGKYLVNITAPEFDHDPAFFLRMSTLDKWHNRLLCLIIRMIDPVIANNAFQESMNLYISVRNLNCKHAVAVIELEMIVKAHAFIERNQRELRSHDSSR